MDIVYKIIVYAVLYLISLFVFFYLLVIFFPKNALTVRADRNTSTDRGVEKYKFPNGRAVVYEPHPRYRLHVSKYVLYCKEGYKFLRCKLSENVKKLMYEVYMFDNHGRLIDVVSVDDVADEKNRSSEIRLHQSTSYTRLLFRRINGEIIDGEQKLYIPRYSAWILRGVVSIVIFIEMLLTRYVTIKIFELIFQFPLRLNVLWLVPWAFLLGCLYALSVLKHYRKKGITVKKNGGRV